MYLRLEKLNLLNKSKNHIKQNTQQIPSSYVLPSISTTKKLKGRMSNSNNNYAYFHQYSKNLISTNKIPLYNLTTKDFFSQAPKSNRNAPKQNNHYSFNSNSLIKPSVSNKFLPNNYSVIKNATAEENKIQTINIIFGDNKEKDPQKKEDTMFLTKVGFRNKSMSIKRNKGSDNELKELMRTLRMTKEQISKEQLDLQDIMKSTKDTHDKITYLTKYGSKWV